MDDSARHWDRMARGFRRWTPPLRPSSEDVAVPRRVAYEIYEKRRHPLKIVLWGVTPELATLDWPPGTFLTAVDRSPGMIRYVWPGDVPGVRRAICADWRETARLMEEPADLLLGDGSFNTLRFPEAWREYLAAARSVLADEGRLVLRFYVQAPRRQSPREVLSELAAGRVRGFHAFKFLLAMAVQPSTVEGVRVADVWEAWNDLRAEIEACPAAAAWEPKTVATIELYRNNPERYWFPTFAEIQTLFEEVVELISVEYPGYEMGDRCPTAVFRETGS
ncbi:MAG: class I SAM-dependent methyltransferase [Acidobacteriota bacterium]